MASAEDDVNMGNASAAAAAAADNDDDDFEDVELPSDNYDSDGSLISSSGDSSSDEDPSDRAPERESTPPPQEDPELAALTEDVDNLCSQATQQLDLLPRKTRNKLTSKTREIFKSYEQHGSQQRLALALEKFLLAPDTDALDYTPRPAPTSLPKVTRTVDAESAPLVRELPFHAADLHLEISGDVAVPPWLLPSLDRIFGLYAAEARALLKHHCVKYGDEAIFRAGIREYIQSQLKGILESTGESDLNLSPETRRFLRSVFERSPELNLAEKRMLARATRLGVETVEMFWEDMHVRRRAWWGMRAFVRAREVERIREEKAQEERGTSLGADGLDGSV
jgi:hypothetical protein